ncbi:MAG: hypothetical protein F6K48_26535 [Okeania sp. SIO3H1]|nr:hypothetical protein [Okeania sp. SIO3H1]
MLFVGDRRQPTPHPSQPTPNPSQEGRGRQETGEMGMRGEVGVRIFRMIFLP